MRRRGPKPQLVPKQAREEIVEHGMALFKEKCHAAEAKRALGLAQDAGQEVTQEAKSAAESRRAKAGQEWNDFITRNPQLESEIFAALLEESRKKP